MTTQQSTKHPDVFFHFALCICLLHISGCSSEEIALKGNALQLQHQGKNYVMQDGNLYEQSGKSLSFVKTLYDVNHREKIYYKKDGHMLARAQGRDIVLPKNIIENFENSVDLPSLLRKEEYWTSITTLSPSNPTVADYNKLAKGIKQGTAQFTDNRIDIAKNIKQSGTQSLRFYAVEPKGFGKTSWITKSSISSNLLHHAKGDTFSSSAYFYIDKGQPVSLMDIEASYVDEGPGLRVLLSKDLKPRLELKWANKPTWHCTKDITLPRKQWFKLEMQAKLDDQNNGWVKLFLDDTCIIEGTGQTMPFEDVIYDRLEIGITANNKGSDCSLYVDDIKHF